MFVPVVRDTFICWFWWIDIFFRCSCFHSFRRLLSLSNSRARCSLKWFVSLLHICGHTRLVVSNNTRSHLKLWPLSSTHLIVNSFLLVFALVPYCAYPFFLSSIFIHLSSTQTIPDISPFHTFYQDIAPECNVVAILLGWREEQQKKSYTTYKLFLFPEFAPHVSSGSSAVASLILSWSRWLTWSIDRSSSLASMLPACFHVLFIIM